MVFGESPADDPLEVSDPAGGRRPFPPGQLALALAPAQDLPPKEVHRPPPSRVEQIGRRPKDVRHAAEILAPGAARPSDSFASDGGHCRVPGSGNRRLSNSLTAKKNASAARVQAASGMNEIRQPEGYFTGDIRDSPGGCGRSFGNDGLGGMDDCNLLNARCPEFGTWHPAKTDSSASWNDIRLSR